MTKVRWGVLSTAKIGTEKVIPAMQQGAHCDVIGMASRNLETAQKTAQGLGIPKAYGSYEEMLADPEIDAVYKPLAQSSSCSLVHQGLGSRKTRALRKTNRLDSG